MLAVVTASGCDSGHSDSSFGRANVLPAPGSSGPDLSDSHVEANVTVDFSTTVSYSSPMFDAQTGQMTSQMALPMPPTRFAIQAGYDSQGAFTFDQTALDPPGNPLTDNVDNVRQIQIRNSVVTLIDGNGYALADPDGGAGPSLLAILGARTSDPLVFMDGLVVTSFPQTGTTTQRPDGTSSTVSSVSTSGTLTTVSSVVRSTSAATPDLTTRRTYAQRGSEHVLAEVQMDIASQTAGTSLSGVATIRFDQVSYSRNTQMDAARRGGTASNAWISPGGGPQSLPPAPCDSSRPDNDCTSGPGVIIGGPGGTVTCPPTTGGANLVYVHGIKSNGAAWGDVAAGPGARGGVIGPVRCDLRIRAETTPSLTAGGAEGTGRHTDQATQLLGVAQVIPQPIFIAHSQGGLISRRVAQRMTQTNGLGSVRAVVTTGTPHRGAPIANTLNPRVGMGDLIRVLTGGAACRIVPCTSISPAFSAFRDGFLAAHFSSPAMSDLRPDSDAIGEVNRVTETFPRYGITNAIPRRWAFARVAGDSKADNSGDALAASMQRLYWKALTGVVVGAFLPWIPTAPLAFVVVSLDLTDRWWTEITVGNDQGDGVVPTLSQKYPGNVVIEYIAPNPVSHTAEIDTRRSANAIEFVLETYAGVQRR